MVSSPGTSLFLAPSPSASTQEPRQRNANKTHAASAAGPPPAPAPGPAPLPPSGPGLEQLARNGLARFFKEGIGAGIWRVFDKLDFRIAYVGTAVSNLAHLVDLNKACRPQPLSPAAAAGHPDNSYGGGRALHYPYPPIRPHKSWKPSVQDWGFPLAQDLASDVASFPVGEVRDALVASYFRHVHPFLPVVAEPWFMAAYRNTDEPPPLLLFQAVLMAGAHSCTHPLVARDRHAVKSIIFRRAALLFHTRHETDRAHLMQAALLFTWHVGDGDTITAGPWYWAGIALRIACGMGMHRASAVLPQHEASHQRRCWWLAFICEVLSALETGRPCSISAEDTDQIMLVDDDLTSYPADGSIDYAAAAAAAAAGTTGSTATSSAGRSPASVAEAATSSARAGESGSTRRRGGPNATFLNRMVELCYIGLDILALSAPSQRRIVDIESIDVRLGLWSLRAGINNSSPHDDSGDRSSKVAAEAAAAASDARPGDGHAPRDEVDEDEEDDDDDTDAVAEQCQLRMHYNLMLLHLHRSYSYTAPVTPSSPSVCSGAARAIIASLERLATLRGGLGRCHFSAVSAATAAAIQTANEVREAAQSRSFIVVMPALEQLARLLHITAQLAKHWPNAQAVHDVFQELHHEYDTLVTHSLRGEEVMIRQTQPDWNLLLGGLQVARLTGLPTEQEWLNMPEGPL